MQKNAVSEEENVYLKNLKTIKNIRDIVKEQGELHLPQMCVIGDQSSGKSSLLQQLTGIKFPVNSGICTKAPIYVHCIRDEKMDEDEYEINGKKCNEEDVKEEILKVQQDLLTKGNMKVSKTEIKVTVRGPNQMDIIVIDLPGIIHHGDGRQETVDLINTYIAPSQTLIIVVSEAKQDKEGIKALGLAEKVDTTNERTLRVLTKCDVFDSEEAKVRAVQLVRDESEYALGAHAVICRPAGRQYSLIAEENTLHKLMAMSSCRSGVNSLKLRLPELFSRLIKKNLSGLRAQITTKLIESKHELDQIGDKAPNRTAIVRLCQKQLLSQVRAFDASVGLQYHEFKSSIQKTGKNITQEMTDKYVIEDPLQCPFFQGREAFDQGIAEINVWWDQHLQAFCSSIKHLMEVSVECNVPCSTVDFKTAVENEWMAFCDEIFKVFEEECAKALRRENQFGTNNHYLTSKYVEEMSIPDTILDSAIDSIEQSDFLDKNNRVRWKSTWNENFKKKISAKLKEHLADFARKSLHEQQQQRVFAAVKAHWGVEFKTFTDTILKIVKMNLVDVRTEWISATMLVNENICNHAMESNVIRNRRKYLKESIKRMMKCQREINRIG